jgi:hypothetical protein
MPRSRKGGTLASYFYEDITGLQQTSGPKTKTATFLPEQKAPKLGNKNRGRRKGKSAPAASEPGPDRMSKKGIRNQMAEHLKAMKDHFHETETIYESHPAWPLTPIYQKIQACILKCKEEIRGTRSHTGVGRHKLNVEAVHAKRIDTSGWGFKAIHDAITEYVHQAKPNHLTLEKPHHHADGTHMYVNVVLAWLFAAKRQLMSNLSVYLEQVFNKTPATAKFLEHEHKAREALAAFHRDKRELPGRKRKSYDLHDKTLLDEQYAAMYKQH